MRNEKAKIPEDLIRSAAKGDDAAAGRLIDLTQDRLFRFAFYLCGNRELAQEICQETYIKALGSLGRLEKTDAFLDWLLRIAKNTFLDVVRSQPKEEQGGAEEELARAEAPSADEHHVLSVQAVLATFEPEDRAVLVLVDMEEHSYREAGEILGMSEDAIRSRLHRLRKDFMDRWQKEGKRRRA